MLRMVPLPFQGRIFPVALARRPCIGFGASVAKKRTHPAVRFLWVIAILIMLFLAAAIGYRVFEKQLMRWVMVPSAPFSAVPMPAGADYRQARMWVARPDIPGNPSLWTPPGFQPVLVPRASIFFVHPTSFLE